ncbi:hypothetical protein L2095_23590 [Bacillus zanthoxyli]|nr:hypothetical protein [Bacillus zanthoxyli]
MKENIVHITVGVLFDLYVKDLIKKETYDDCIRAYKEYQQSKDNVTITSDAGEPLLNIDGTIAQYHPGTHVKLAEPIEFVHAPADGKWREGHAVHGPSVDMEFYKDRLVLRCIETIRSKLIYGESIEQAFDNPIYIYDLSEDEKRFVERYFRNSPPIHKEDDK